MQRLYKFRIYPNKEQELLEQNFFLCYRFVYNYYLNKHIQMYKTNKSTMGCGRCYNDLINLKIEYG